MSDQHRVRVKPLPAESPRSSAVNWEPPQNIKPEQDALEKLKVSIPKPDLVTINSVNFPRTNGSAILPINLTTVAREVEKF
jgi:hypothetical protein